MKVIQLSNGKAAKVDDSDWECLSVYNWQCSHGYASRMTSRPNRTCLRMHRLILDCKPSEHVDHIDGDKLNNQRDNLRIATRSQNLANMSKHRDALHSRFKGVTYDRHRTNGRPWFVRGNANNKSHHVGYFSSEIEAAAAYNEWAIATHGRFARVNQL